MKRRGVGIVGVGKVARDEHIPALNRSPDFVLLGIAGGSSKPEGLAGFATIEEMLDGLPGLEAVAICTPPQAHYDAARLALERRKHVLLEKPPCSTVAQLDHLHQLALRNDCTLFQTWHARQAAAVDVARQWLADRRVHKGRVVWKEDVRQWHPGQTWIWEEGGFGVLDAGINAVSILTKIVPKALRAESGLLLVPSNCATPIAAEAVLRTTSGAAIDAEFDFRHHDSQDRTITLETDGGILRLSDHGTRLFIDGVPAATVDREEEYPSLYAHFAGLIEQGACDVDKRPFQLICDLLQVGRKRIVEPFSE